jgi:hypothetical protein
MFGSNRLQRDYVTFSFLLEDILKEMGHEVERKKTLVGEVIYDKYDFAFCGVAPVNSLTSGRIVETHYTLKRMEGRSAVYADDWSFCNYGNSIRGALNKWEKFLQYKKFPYSADIIEDTKHSLENMINYDENNNAPVLAPMFPWGNHKILMIGSDGELNYSAKLSTIDPSEWVTYPKVVIPKPFERERQWVMAALSNHSAWVKKQGFKLPVKYVGCKSMQNDLLTEDETVQLFSNSFGVLATGYPSAGSGWWRTRYLNAAWAESIVYSDPKDAEMMGRPYRGTPEFFESIQSEKEYEELAFEQANWLQTHTSSKETTMQILERLIKK